MSCLRLIGYCFIGVVVHTYIHIANCIPNEALGVLDDRGSLVHFVEVSLSSLCTADV